jgi:hypothetical protein
MSNMETSVEDFEFNSEESYFTHMPSDFRLDCDFVLLFNYDDIIRLFAVSSGNYILSNETIDQLRAIVSNFRESKMVDQIAASNVGFVMEN